MNAKAEKKAAHKIEVCEKADAKQILEAVLILRRQLLKEDEMKLVFMAKQKIQLTMVLVSFFY